MLREVAVVCARELRKNLRSAKGLAATLLFSLGGAAAVLVHHGFSRFVDEETQGRLTPEATREMRRRAMMALFDDATVADYLANSPTVLLFLYNATLLFLPLLTMLLGYDTIAGELQHRTMRYTAARARRESIVVGKALALWVSVAAVSLVPSAFAWVNVIARGEATAGTTLHFGAHFWAMAVVLASAYAGLTTLVSSFFRTPMLALLTTLGTSFALWVLKTVLSFSGISENLRKLRFLLPGAWENRLLSPKPEDFGVGIIACLAFMAACTGLACVSLRKRDL